MDKKIPIYYAKIDETATGQDLKIQGIQNIALVESPAMLTEWLMFEEHKKQELKFAFNEELQIVTAPVIIADMPIYRIVDGKEFYVVYKKDTNLQILQKYMYDGNQKKIKLTHDTNELSKGAYVFEVFMSDVKRGIKQPEGFDLPDGTIFASLKIDNPDLWKRIKAGEVKGISLEGFFDLQKEVELSQDEIEAVVNAIVN